MQMMKKIVRGMLILVALSMMITPCFAGHMGPMRGSLDRSQIALGGIAIGTTQSAVRNIYGSPTSIVRTSPACPVYKYGSSFRICFIPGSELGMSEMGAYIISTTANNGIATPDGITVGMTPKTLNDVYGAADRIENNRDGSKEYQYWDKDNDCTALYFLVRDGVIRSITCYYYV